MMSNLVNGKIINLKQGNKNYGQMDILTYMDNLGFKNLENFERQ